MTSAAAAARHNVRPLLHGDAAALRDAVVDLGVSPEAFSRLATLGSVEALALGGLGADQVRVLERQLRSAGGEIFSDHDATRAVIVGPLQVIAELPAQLREWGRATEELGDCIGDVLMLRSGAPAPLRCGDHTLRFDEGTLVMGVVNVTPDSFAGDGVGDDLAGAVARARRMVADGAAIIDVGGESTRPNSTAVDADEETARVLPAVEAIRAAVDVPVSIDTRKATVAQRAIEAGAVIVNDVWGLRGDPQMAAVIAAHPQVGAVVMHNAEAPGHTDLMGEICAVLRDSVRIAADHGIAAERLIIDPGFGFAKTPADNLELMRGLHQLRGFGRPVLVGPSRKFTVGAILDGAPPEQRVEGSVALCVLAAASGAQMVRVHDVAATVRALRVTDAVVRGTPPAIAALPMPGPTG